MSKIEKGCVAIIVKGKQTKHVLTNIGKIVKVGNFLGEVERWVGDDYWEVDVLMNGSKGENAHLNKESYMQRIDDPITEKQKEKEACDV